MLSANVTAAQVVPITKGPHWDASSDQARVAREAGHWPRVFTKDGVHPFDEVEWRKADAEIRNAEGKVVFVQKDIEVPAWWTQNNINVVADKYFRMINGVKENSVKQMFTRVCSTLRRWAEEQKYFNTDKDAQVFEEELCYALLHQYGAFNSPVWFNLGITGRAQMASACFIQDVNDSIEDIMKYQTAEMKIFRSGSGSGANISKLRSSYEKISSGSYTSGPLSWMEGLDAYAKAMKSGGATRNAAKMVVMDMDHPDILITRDGRPGFVRSKADEEILAHKLVEAGYSVAYDDPNGAYKRIRYQAANHSVSVPDSFMQAMLDDGTWETKERRSGKVVHKYKARELWNEIAQAAWTCGDPGVQFSDAINKWHTTPKSGPIRASNPCSEFLHVDNTACNLCAINLTKFFDGRKFVRSRFEQAVRLFSTSQMAIVDKADYPTEEIAFNSHKLRPIGTNYGDLGALLMKLGYGYDTNEGRAVAAQMASLMTGMVYVTAAKLAARVGAFPDYDLNREDMLRVMRMHQEADSHITKRWQLESSPTSDDVVSTSSEVWREAIALGEKYGYSVSQASLQAPLGTISFLMGMSTTGIEPAFSLVSYKSLVGGGSMKIVNSGVRDALVGLGYAEDQVERICKYVEDHGTIAGAPGLKDEHLPVFDCAMPSGLNGRYLSPMAHIKMMAAIQPLITCAMSKTVNLPSEITANEIAKIYEESWRLGLKCIALYRDGCKASQPLSTKKDPELKLTDVATEKAVVAATIPTETAVEREIQQRIRSGALREKLPAEIVSWRHKFDIDGYKGYIIVGEYVDGRPGEVFLKLGKPGSTISGLIDGFTQLMSIALQYGVPLPKLIQSFIDTRFEPAGMTQNKHIRFAKSLYDYLFKVLDVRYYGGHHSGLKDKLDAMKATEPPPMVDVREGMTKEPESTTYSVVEEPQTRKSLDAPACVRCGSITQRNGSCYLCTSCGQTTGCS
jgi:ribonucleoside-diphosphate reductase alpha chain